MKKLFTLATAMLLFVSYAFAQESSKSAIFTPGKGDFSIGVTFNPAALSQKAKYQPSEGTFAGDWVSSQGDYPKQMFFLSSDPLASFMLKYRFSNHWGIRASIGFNGSKTNYKEYVQDDLSYKDNSETTNLNVDIVQANLNSMTIGLSAEYTKSFGRLAFISGFGIQYALGGGNLNFTYGNQYCEDNPNPTTMPYAKLSTNELPTLNEYQYVAGPSWYYQGFDTKNVASARPLDRYNIGYCSGIGFTVDMGLEYYFSGTMSISAAATFTPLMVVFQPQTYTNFEGWDASEKTRVEFHHLVSPGSSSLLYGTENLGFRLGFNYYFK